MLSVLSFAIGKKGGIITLINSLKSITNLKRREVQNYYYIIFINNIYIFSVRSSIVISPSYFSLELLLSFFWFFCIFNILCQLLKCCICVSFFDPFYSKSDLSPFRIFHCSFIQSFSCYFLLFNCCFCLNVVSSLYVLVQLNSVKYFSSFSSSFNLF